MRAFCPAPACPKAFVTPARHGAALGHQVAQSLLIGGRFPQLSGEGLMRNLVSTLALAAALALPGVAGAAELAAAEAALEAGNYSEAVTLYRAAGEAGDPRAQVTLGFMFLYGEAHYGSAVQADLNTSLVWFARAADQGNAVATSMLTSLFEVGDFAPSTQSLAASGIKQRY
jgi:TPR repeat protein